MKIKLNAFMCALAIGAVVLSGIAVVPSGVFPSPGAAAGQDDWKKEFDDICSKTQDSMALPSDELKRLIDRCDALRPRIEKLDDTRKRVYLKRLRLCRDLFTFVLETKEGK
jgi:hypothetical protein